MRIIIEPTTKEQVEGTEDFGTQYPKVILQYPQDHMDLYAWLEIFQLVLKNVGFLESQAEKLMFEEDKDEQ